MTTGTRDVTFIETPPFGAVLTLASLPPCGGDTLWSSTVAAYLALSEPLRQLIDGAHRGSTTSKKLSTPSLGSRRKGCAVGESGCGQSACRSPSC